MATQQESLEAGRMLRTLLKSERRSKANEDQQQRRDLTGGKLARHPAAVAYRFGQAREQFAQAQIHRDTQFGAQPYLVLAEALALQGEFAEAVLCLPEGSQRSEYEQKAKALAAVGQRQCQCPERKIVKQTGNAKGKWMQTSSIDQQVMQAGVVLINIMRCETCKTFFAVVG